MLVHIVARGRIGRTPEAELVERYLARIAWPTKVTELPDRGGKMPPAGPGTIRIILDEKGKSLGSVAFAEQIGRWRDNGARELRFLIGAADGFDDPARAEADFLLNLGALTWPHMLARAMLAEQLWRAASILAGHPYHREG
jgi:23S rRNA (pseudouridine1915-N3)-methyltransferase